MCTVGTVYTYSVNCNASTYSNYSLYCVVCNGSIVRTACKVNTAYNVFILCTLIFYKNVPYKKLRLRLDKN